MKKIIALLLAVMMVLSLAACGEKDEPVEEIPAEPEVVEEPEIVEEPVVEPEPTELPEIDKLADAAMEEKELKVICSCSEDIAAAAAGEFEAIYGIPVTYECKSIEEAAAAVEAGCDADIWLGAPSVVLEAAAAKGLLLAYEAENTINLLGDSFKAEDGSWYGIYADVMGFTYNVDAFAKNPEKLPATWDDLYKEEYAGKLCGSLQDGNAAAAVAAGEYDIAVGAVSFGVARALGGSKLDFAVPGGKLQCMLTGAAIISGCAHENSAKSFIEFLLTDFAEPTDLSHMGLFPVVADAAVPAIAVALELNISEAEIVPLDGSEDLPGMVEKLK